jgi:subtilisin-like proprotein convertase family protein
LTLFDRLDTAQDNVNITYYLPTALATGPWRLTMQDFAAPDAGTIQNLRITSGANSRAAAGTPLAIPDAGAAVFVEVPADIIPPTYVSRSVSPASGSQTNTVAITVTANDTACGPFVSSHHVVF